MPEVLDNFLVIEGIDGSGTTTQALMIRDFFESKGKRAYVTAEPSKGSIGRFIRENVQNRGSSLSPLSALHLYVADRIEHIYGSQGVLERLKSGELVVQDRYFFSTLAYQGVDVPLEKVLLLNSGFPYPRHLIYLRCPVAKCMERIASRGADADVFENEDFLRKVSANYDECLKRLPSSVRFCDVDSSKSADGTFRAIRPFLESI